MHKKIKKLITTIAVFVLLVFVAFWVWKPSPAAAGWFDDNWMYRNAIPISSHTAAENNVYVAATIDTSASGQFQADCGDLRFTDYAGNVLNYYVVSGCTTATTVVHIFFDTMPAGAGTIYYYYGNPSATNGFAAADFATQATSYAVGSIGSQEKGGAPVAYWKLDDGTGTNTQDSSINNNDGTITGATWQTEDMCVSGKCLRFDGSSNYVNIPVTASLQITNQTTVEAWVKPLSSAGYRWIFFKESSGDSQDIAIQINPSGNWRCATNGGTGDVDTGIAVVLNQWTHITLVYTTSSLECYVNGVSRGGVDSSPGTLVGNSNPIILAGYPTTPSTFFNGFIDSVKVFNYARTAAQIKSDFAARGLSKGSSVSLGSKASDLGSLSNGLVGYWKMDETSGNRVDSSGNGNTLTDNNTVTANPGKFGNAGQFTAANFEYLSITDNAALSVGDQDFTIAAWVYLNSLSPRRAIVSKTDAGVAADEFTFMVETDGSVTFQIDNAEAGAQAQTAAGTISTGTWYFLVAYHDSVNNTVNIIVNNGTPTTTATGASVPVDSTKPFEIGRADANNYYMDGRIEEVRYYKRLLTPVERTQLYNWAPGPIAYWNLDEGTAGNAIDASGNGYTGTSTGTTVIPGKYGKARSFNGSSDYISGTNFNMGSQGTISAWVKTSITSGSGIVFQQVDTTPGANRYLWAYVDTYSSGHAKIALYVGGDGAIQNQLIKGINIDDNQWHFLTWISTGSAYKLYVDTVEQTSVTYSYGSDNGKWYSDLGTINQFNIGRSNRNSENDKYFNGQIDQIKIYNYPRTQKQIVEDMNSGHPAGGSPIGSQVGYWKFDEVNGDISKDSSVYQNSANLGDFDNTCPGSIYCPTLTKNGKYNSALSFDGTNDYAVIADSAALSPTSELTVSVWVNQTAATAGKTIIGKWHHTDQATWVIQVDPTGSQLQFVIANALTDTGQNYGDTPTGTWTTGWHHIVMIYRGSGSSNADKLKAYLDGKPVSLSFTGTIAASLTDSTAYVYVGALGGFGKYFNGLIDEVKIYNFALSTDEVALEYNRGSAQALGALGSSSSYAPHAGNQIYCIPGDASTCTAPVGEWNFEEKTSNLVYDASGNNNNFTLGSGANSPSWTSGKIGTALSFDNSNDYASASDNSNLEPGTGNFTVEAWIYPTAISDLETIIAKNPTTTYNCGAGNRHWRLILRPDSGNIVEYLACDSANGNNIHAWTTSTLSVNRWYHIVAVHNLTANPDTVTFYINGKPDTTTYQTQNDVTTATYSGSSLYLGELTGSQYPFSGKIDQIRLYNYARTPAQVAWDYNRGAPVGHWKLDECQGATVYDSSPSGNTGTVTIGATGTQTAAGTCTSSGAWFNGVTGKYNSSLNFDGTDDYVSVSDADSLSFTNKIMSLSLWLKADTLDSTEGLIVKRTGNSAYEYALYLSSGAPEFVLWTNAGASVCDALGSTALQTGRWYFVSATADGSNCKVYVNGTQDGTGAISGTVTNDTALVYIGYDNSGVSARHFNGQIDDVKVFNYALTATQIKTLYNENSATRFGP